MKRKKGEKIVEYSNVPLWLRGGKSPLDLWFQVHPVRSEAIKNKELKINIKNIKNIKNKNKNMKIADGIWKITDSGNNKMSKNK